MSTRPAGRPCVDWESTLGFLSRIFVFDEAASFAEADELSQSPRRRCPRVSFGPPLHTRLGRNDAD